MKMSEESEWSLPSIGHTGSLQHYIRWLHSGSVGSCWGPSVWDICLFPLCLCGFFFKDMNTSQLSIGVAVSW